MAENRLLEILLKLKDEASAELKKFQKEIAPAE